MHRNVLADIKFFKKIYTFKWMFVAVILMFSSYLSAQDAIKKSIHSISLNTQFFQIKDEFNYGLVFSGLNLVGHYSLEKTIKKSTIKYSPELSLGANYDKGVGLAFGFIPIDIFYGLQVKNNKHYPLTIGAYFTTDYNWQLYPELQSGHMFWFTSIEIGPQVVFSLPLKKRALKIMVSNSLAGFTSRPQPATESYYYSLTFSDFVSNVHSNLEFGSYNLFNHTKLEVELLNIKKKRLSLAYEFEYFGYFKAPKLSYLAHSLNLNWKIGKL